MKYCRHFTWRTSERHTRTVGRSIIVFLTTRDIQWAFLRRFLVYVNVLFALPTLTAAASFALCTNSTFLFCWLESVMLSFLHYFDSAVLFGWKEQRLPIKNLCHLTIIIIINGEGNLTSGCIASAHWGTRIV